MKIIGTDLVTYYVGNFHAAVMFYRDTLGLPLKTYHDHDLWAEFDCGNVTLGVQGGGEIMPGDHAPRIVLAVRDLAAAQAELKARGVNIVRPPQEDDADLQLELLDPDGNIIVLHQRPQPTAD